ncbi:hypothetical protein KKC88_03270 [Patescibacteria group bacterium]|nr:hypothetical protein [Patescibacteria group bacterium]MBU1673003.1 hypothetical protein [Patescibacteria group bacterium]MBU1964162.1 hypothetical protein [Patescibacteria group bacterium]
MFKFIWDLLFPIQCLGGCGQYDMWLCPKCAETFKPVKKKGNLFFISDYKDELMQKLIHTLKYNYCEEAGRDLGKLLAEAIDEEFDYCLPSPISRSRKRERGFNQAEILCRAMDIKLNLDLIKIKNTRSQMTLNREERLVNLENCFKYKNNIDIKGKKLLLVDDVWTTGTTMGEMTRELEKFAPKEIWYAVLAKGDS